LKYRLKVLAGTTPSETDEPTMLLDKLAKHRTTIIFRQATLKGHDGEQPVLVLTPWREPAHVWVAPQAVVEPIDSDDFEGLNKLQEIVELRIQDAAEVAHLVRERVKHKKWNVYWRPGAPVSGPYRKEVAALTELNSTAPLLTRTD
jgi:hypothetical protein